MRRVDPTHWWRGGRVAEGGGLLNRYTVNSRIVGSNPIPSATTIPLIRGASRQTIEAQIWPSVPVFGSKRIGPICAPILGHSAMMHQTHLTSGILRTTTAAPD